MANLSLTRVNQKLAQARYLLALLQEAALAPVERGALQEAVAFHLQSAYRHYLREIAETYGLKHSFAISDEAGLVAAFESAKKYPVEAQELSSLRADSQSWLAQLGRYYDSLWQVPVAIERKEEDINLIALVQEDVGRLKPVSVELLASWHQAFVVLVRRQRETSAEF